MITREQAKAMVQERDKQVELEKEKIIQDLLENEISPKIEESAKNGSYYVTVGYNKSIIADLAQAIRESGFSASIQHTNTRNGYILISWN